MSSRLLSRAAAVIALCGGWQSLSASPASVASPLSQRESAERGRALLERARASRGGARRLEQVKALQLRERDVVTTILLPDLYRVEMAAPFGTITTVFDGNDLWQIWPAGAPSVPKPDPNRARAAARATLAGFTLMYLTQAGPLGQSTPVAEGKQAWGPVSGEIVRFPTASASGDAAWALVLGDNMRPVGLLTPSRTAPTGPVAGYSLTVMADYRDVSGVQFPFKTQLYRVDAGGKVTQTLPSKRLEGLEVNPRISRAQLVAR